MIFFIFNCSHDNLIVAEDHEFVDYGPPTGGNDMYFSRNTRARRAPQNENSVDAAIAEFYAATNCFIGG